jgi:putative PEP-CTERM system histidine kinase
MSLSSLLSYIGALFSVGLAVLVFVRDRKAFVHRIFAIGMVLLAIEAVIGGISLRALFTGEVLYWNRIRLIDKAVIPGVWLLFALAYSRINYKEIISKWRWIVSATFIVPVALVTIFWGNFFIGEPVLDSNSVWLIPLGWSGYAFNLCMLLSSILILMNLERTLRGSVGHKRWQVKYMVLGIGSIFAVWVYTSSQSILFYTLNTNLTLASGWVLIVASILTLRSVLRTPLLDLDLYLSHAFLYNSITVLIVGIYLLVVGILAKILNYLNLGRSLYLNAFFVFLALVGLSIVLLSDRLRRKTKHFISVHMKKPQYDYRKEWTEFTQMTTSLTDIKDLCSAIVKKVSNTFETLSVTIWLMDENEGRLMLGGSTALTELQAQNVIRALQGGGGVISGLCKKVTHVDFETSKESWVIDLKKAHSDFLKEARIRYCIPLAMSDQFIGFLTLHDRVAEIPLSDADFDLLKTIADQTAGMLLNLKLSERLRQAKEIEVLQTMSAFLMHDLKNLASSLSLTMENLPIHFDNPEFRNDALKIVQQSVNKVNSLCGHLSMLSQKIELKKVETDLNELIASSLSCLNGSATVSIFKDLQPVPRLMIDPDQVQKVLMNLILNANEALGNGGEIRVATEKSDGWAIVSVRDNGCGMTKEFIEKSLFRPFKTTKKQGMGIGLFQSKMIVEAHQGRIEVESEEGRGTTFRVFLPVAGK